MYGFFDHFKLACANKISSVRDKIRNIFTLSKYWKIYFEKIDTPHENSFEIQYTVVHLQLSFTWSFATKLQNIHKVIEYNKIYIDDICNLPISDMQIDYKALHVT